MNRRQMLRGAGAATGAALARPSQVYAAATRGLPPLKITNVKTILTNPPSLGGRVTPMGRLVIAKVETSEPGLYGVGCASFCFRPHSVATTIEKYLKPFVIGKDPDMIEDLFLTMNASSLWRNGPILNYAVSGVDIALWDIKAKRANMPLYQLLGGKTRGAVQVYGDAGGNDPVKVADMVQQRMAEGYRHVRLNYVGSKVDESPALEGMPVAPADDPIARGIPMVIDPQEWVREIPRVFEQVRKTCGEKVELMQHLHGQLPPSGTIAMIKRLEPLRPYFFEDPFYPEDIGYMKNLRQQTTVPIAIGEKFVHQHEYVGLITDRLMDFIRVHIPTIGGLTRARKLAILGEWFAVRTAWHAPFDLSPVGHAVNGHLDLASPNFGIQEGSVIHGEALREVFPGTPVIKRGYLFVNEAPGHGVDINEQAAAKWPVGDDAGNFGPRRAPNGTVLSN